MPVYDLTLQMLSPVHVGTGDEIDPTEYVVREVPKHRGSFELLALDLPRLLSSLTPPERAKFDAAVRDKSVTLVRRFIAEHPRLSQFVRWQAQADAELHSHYKNGLTSGSARLAVHPMTRDAVTGRPYIPGSTIKGALRTAWIARKAAPLAPKEAPWRGEDRHFEPRVLGYLDDSTGRPRVELRADPFRALRISDAPLCDDDTNIITRVTIYKPDRSAGQPDPAGIQMFYDMTFSRLDAPDDPVTAAGRLAIDDRLAQTRARSDRWNFDHCVADGFSAEELLDACHAFYAERLQQEFAKFHDRNPRAAQHREPLGRLRAAADHRTPGTALIRLGRFNHFECVTVAPFARPPERGAGKTRTLADGWMPLGWACLTLRPRAP